MNTAATYQYLCDVRPDGDVVLTEEETKDFENWLCRFVHATVFNSWRFRKIKTLKDKNIKEMKKHIYSLAAILCCLMATMAFTACNKDNPSADDQIAELKAWLNIDEKGESAFICNDEDVYFVGASNQSDASKIARNLSLGASEKGSLTLSGDLGTIRVSTPADNNGIYFEINYNVKGISVKKLVIINNEVLENGDENWYFPPKNKYYYYICNDCPVDSNEFSTTGKPTKCPKCGSTNISLK